MSPLWRDQIDVFFAPDQINVVRTKRGLKPVKQPVVTERIPDNQDGDPVWLLPMEKLESQLAEAGGSGMTVTLSNYFVRYIVLPPQTEITSPDEVMAYADFRMREIYGARVDNWALSVSPWSPVSGAVCAAISHDLLKQIQELSTRQQIVLNGIEPYLTSVLDQSSHAFNHKKSFLALVENGRICVAVMVDGVWRNIRNQRVLHDLQNELWAVLDQEAVLSGQKEVEEQVLLFAPEHPALMLPSDCGWGVMPLLTDQISVPEHYPTAVAGKVRSGENACPV